MKHIKRWIKHNLQVSMGHQSVQQIVVKRPTKLGQFGIPSHFDMHFSGEEGEITRCVDVNGLRLQERVEERSEERTISLRELSCKLSYPNFLWDKSRWIDLMHGVSRCRIKTAIF